MFSRYLTEDKLDLRNRIDIIYMDEINYFFFINYRYVITYHHLLSYVYCGHKMYVEKQLQNSIHVLYYNIIWAQLQVMVIGLGAELIIWVYIIWLNLIYRSALSKLRRKAGSRRAVYKIEINTNMFRKRFRSGVIFLRKYIKNTMFYFFLSYLVFFNFIVLYNFRSTIFFSQKVIGGEIFMLRSRRRKRRNWRFYRRRSVFKRRKRFLT